MKTTKKFFAVVLCMIMLTVNAIAAFAGYEEDLLDQARASGSSNGDGYTPYRLRWSIDRDEGVECITFSGQMTEPPEDIVDSEKIIGYEVLLYRDGACIEHINYEGVQEEPIDIIYNDEIYYEAGEYVFVVQLVVFEQDADGLKIAERLGEPVKSIVFAVDIPRATPSAPPKFEPVFTDEFVKDINAIKDKYSDNDWHSTVLSQVMLQMYEGKVLTDTYGALDAAYNGRGFYFIQYATPEDATRALELLRANPDVDYAERNGFVGGAAESTPLVLPEPASQEPEPMAEPTATPEPTALPEPMPMPTVEPTPPPTKIAFSDVDKDDWFYGDVIFAVENSLFNGISETEFAPQDTMTRAMFITVLARIAGVDTTGGSAWYSKAVEWGTESGIMDGEDLKGAVTREQLAVMLARYMRYTGADIILTAEYRMFADEADISDYAKSAVQDMNKLGIINGKGDGVIDPLGNSTRAEVAAMLHRFAELGI